MKAKSILSTVLRRYCIIEIEGGIKGLEEYPENDFRIVGCEWYLGEIVIKITSVAHRCNINVQAQ
jgi:hypothetical protein